MRVFRWLVCVLVALACSGCVETGYLYVTVVDADGEGVGGVEVEVFDKFFSPGTGSAPVVSGATNFEGKIEFMLEEDDYKVYVTSSSYVVAFPGADRQQDVTVTDDGGFVTFQAAPLREISVDLRWGGRSESIPGPDLFLELIDETGTPRHTRFTDWPRVLTFDVPPRLHRVRVSEFPNWISFEETVLETTTVDDWTVVFEAWYVGERAVIAQVVGGDGSPIPGLTVSFLEEATRLHVTGGTTDASGEVRWASPPLGRFVALVSGFDPAQHVFPTTEISIEVESAPGPYLARFEAEAVAANQSPVASITTPTDGTVFSQGQPATFTGTGVDAEDGFLTGSALVWSSSLDGAIGDGESITVSTLQPGGHEITLTATDTDGAVDADTIDVTISASGTATIQGAVTVSGGGFANIRVTATGPTLATTVTDPFGNYTLGGLAAGTYTVTVSEYPSDFTFNPASVTVTVADGATVTQDFMGSGG